MMKEILQLTLQVEEDEVCLTLSKDKDGNYFAEARKQ